MREAVEKTYGIDARLREDAAIRFGESFYASRLMDAVHYSDEALEREALALMRRFRDKGLSFVDAVTIVIVTIERLDGVFGFDQDFTRCGISLFPR